MDQLILSRIQGKKSIALLAPAYIIDFPYPNIIGMLRELGFDKVTELTFGARMVNWWYADYIKKHQDQKYFIASPCPTVVAYIQNKYPDLVQYLMPYASPMVSQARIIRQHYPDHLNIFISPCFAKQNMEVPANKDVLDGAITFKELKAAFDEKKIYNTDYGRSYQFDSMIQEYTKIYPVSGGLAGTAHLKKIFTQAEIFIDDTIPRIDPILKEMVSGTTKYRFLDILNCNGGCIGGPAIVNQHLTIDERREKVKHYVEEASERNLGSHAGRLDYADGVKLDVKYS